MYLLSALSVMYILLMYYISLLLLPPDGFVLCYIGLLMLTLWRFDDDVIGPSPGMGRYNDYDEIFTPVAIFKSIQILLAIAAYHDYEIWQMDVKTTFLNGNILEDVYMRQPEGFANPEDAQKMCKLQ